MFENPEVALDSLPGADDVDWMALHPAFVRRLQLQRLLVLLGAAAVIAVVTIVPLAPFPRAPLWILLLLYAVPTLLWPAIAVPRRGYVVRDKDLLFRSGVVWRSVTAVPFNRVQHVETSSTPFDRQFGLATLQLFTAGGSGADLRIEGLDEDVAEKLRVYVLEKVGSSIENA